MPPEPQALSVYICAFCVDWLGGCGTFHGKDEIERRHGDIDLRCPRHLSDQ